MKHIPIEQIPMGQFRLMNGYVFEYRPDIAGSWRFGLWHGAWRVRP